MKHVPILAIPSTKNIIFGMFLVAILVSSFFLSLFLSSNASATPYTDEYTDVDKKIKAIKYYGLIKTCTSDTPGAYGGFFKTTISGTNIDNGARWWTEQGDSTGINLGIYLDQWNDKNGITGCNGETDSEPGWINDIFKIYGSPIPSKTANGASGATGAGRREFLETVLGYTCTKTSSQWECTNPNANDAAASSPNSIQAKLQAMPYLGGQDPLTITQDRDAMTYILAIEALENVKKCKAIKGGNGNLVKVSKVNPDGSITTTDWSIQNDGGLTRVADSGLPLGVQDLWGNGGKTCQDMATYTVNNAPAAKAWMAKQACATKYPDKVSDSTFLLACAAGWSSPTDYYMCSQKPAAGYSGSTFSTGGRNACFLGQNLPIDPTGATAGELCMALGYSTQTELSACIRGAIHRGESDYCSKTYYTGYVGSTYTDRKDEEDACKDGQSLNVTDGVALLASSANGNANNNPDDTTTTCAIEGVGWIVCPIVNFMAGANDVLYGVLSGLLSTNTEIARADTSNPTYNAWQIARNLANVGFVVVFLIIIFSQISSIGISNYGVKKMLPRLVIAAILVNVSFIICALAIDISNILGGSVVQLFDGMAVFGEPKNASDTGTLAGQVLAGGVALVAGLGAAAAAASAGSLLLPVLAAALLAILVTIFILAARQVVIILLIVLSPLAFLAMLLPNTESLFKQWRKILVAVLIVYPMIGLLFGASTLASKIILGTDPGGFQQIIGIIVLFVPLLLTPSLLQASLKAVPALGGFASTLAKRANSNLSGSANKRLRPMLDSALSNRSAGLTWTGKDRVKRGLMGARIGKDGKVIEGSRRLFGAKTQEVDKHDKDGKVIGKEIIAQKPSRRNFSQVLGDRGKLTEKNIETNKSLANTNFARGGLQFNPDKDERSRTGKNAGRLFDRAQTTGLAQKGVDELYVGRLKGRQINSSDERGLTERLEDAETTVGALDNIIKEEGQLRIKHGAENTAAAAMGVEAMTTELNVDHRDKDGKVISTSVEEVGLNNLADVSKVGFAAAEGTKAAELQIQRSNKESGVASAAIQQQKRAEKGISVYDKQQEAVFKGTALRDKELKTLFNQEDAADRSIKLSDKKQEIRLEQVAHGDKDLQAIQAADNRATIELEKIHLDEKNELEASKLVGGVNADLTAATIESQAESEQIAAELQKIQKESAAGFNVVDAAGNSLFGGPNDGTKTPEELAAIAKERLDRVKKQKQQAIADGYAGNWAEGGIGLDLDKQIAEDQQGEMARRAAGQRIELELGPDGQPIPLPPNPDGSPRLDSNGQQMYQIKGNENIVARSFQRLAADTQGDADALKSQYEREGFATGTMLSNILNVDKDNGSGPPRPPAFDADGNPVPGGVPIAEEVAVIQRIAESGDIGGGVSITEYVASLAKTAKQDQDALELNPDNPELQKKYKASRERAKLVSNAMMNGFAKNSKGKPPWAGGSDEAKWIEGTHTDGPKQQVVNAFTGGKLSGDKFMGMNYEQLKPLNKFFETIGEPDANGNYPELATSIQAAKDKAAKDIPTADFPEGTPERAAEIARVQAEIDSNFSSTLLTLDDLLDNPKYANRLETRQRNELERTRRKFDQIMSIDPGAQAQTPQSPTAVLKRPMIKSPDGKEVPYYRKPPLEYYTTPRPGSDTDT